MDFSNRITDHYYFNHYLLFFDKKYALLALTAEIILDLANKNVIKCIRYHLDKLI